MVFASDDKRFSRFNNAIGPVNQWQTGPITIWIPTALAISET